MQFVASLSPESLVVVNGLLKDASQFNMEIQVRKVFCINRFSPIPYILKDATQSDHQIDSVSPSLDSDFILGLGYHVNISCLQYLQVLGVHPKKTFNSEYLNYENKLGVFVR